MGHGRPMHGQIATKLLEIGEKSKCITSDWEGLVCSLTPRMEAQVDLPSSTRYVNGWSRFPRCTSVHYINGWCGFVAAVNSPMRVDARSCMNVF